MKVVKTSRMDGKEVGMTLGDAVIKIKVVGLVTLKSC